MHLRLSSSYIGALSLVMSSTHKGHPKNYLGKHNKSLGPVILRVDNAFQRVNRYPAHTFLNNELRYPLERNLSSG